LLKEVVCDVFAAFEEFKLVKIGVCAAGFVLKSRERVKNGILKTYDTIFKIIKERSDRHDVDFSNYGEHVRRVTRQELAV
jgi:hypothetical protein